MALIFLGFGGLSGLQTPDIFAFCQIIRAFFYPVILEILQFDRVFLPDILAICLFIRVFLALIILRSYELSGLRIPDFHRIWRIGRAGASSRQDPGSPPMTTGQNSLFCYCRRRRTQQLLFFPRWPFYFSEFCSYSIKGKPPAAVVPVSGSELKNCSFPRGLSGQPHHPAKQRWRASPRGVI